MYRNIAKLVFIIAICCFPSLVFSKQIDASKQAHISDELRAQIIFLAKGSSEIAKQSDDYAYAFRNYLAAAAYYEMLELKDQRLEALEHAKELSVFHKDQEGEYLASALIELAKGNIRDAKDYVLNLTDNSLADGLLKQIEEVERIALKGRTFSLIMALYFDWKDQAEKHFTSIVGKVDSTLFSSEKEFHNKAELMEKAFEKWGQLIPNPNFQYTSEIIKELEKNRDERVTQGIRYFHETNFVRASRIKYLIIETEKIADERKRSEEILMITEKYLLTYARAYVATIMITEMLKEDSHVGAQAKAAQERISKEGIAAAVRDLFSDPMAVVGGVGPLLLARHLSNLYKLKVFANLMKASWKMRVASEVFGLLIEVPVFIVSSAVWQSVFTTYKDVWSIKALAASMGDAFLKFGLLKVACAPLAPIRQGLGSVKVFAKKGAAPIPNAGLGKVIMPLNPLGNTVYGLMGNAGAVSGLMLGGAISEEVGFVPETDMGLLAHIIQEEIFLLQITLGTKGANALSGGRINAALGKQLMDSKLKELRPVVESMGLKPKTQEFDLALRTLLSQHAKGQLTPEQLRILAEAGSPAKTSKARIIFNEYFSKADAPMGYKGKELWFGIEWKNLENPGQFLEPAFQTAEASPRATSSPSVEQRTSNSAHFSPRRRRVNPNGEQKGQIRPRRDNVEQDHAQVINRSELNLPKKTRIKTRKEVQEGDYAIALLADRVQELESAEPVLVKVLEIYTREGVEKVRIRYVKDPDVEGEISITAITNTLDKDISKSRRSISVKSGDELATGREAVIEYEGKPEIVRVEGWDIETGKAIVSRTDKPTELIEGISRDKFVKDPLGKIREHEVGKDKPARERSFSGVAAEQAKQRYFSVGVGSAGKRESSRVLGKTKFPKMELWMHEVMGKEKWRVKILKKMHKKKAKLPVLNSSIVKNAGLEPKHKMSYDGVNYYFSDAFTQGRDSRIQFICYVEINGEVYARALYKSNSHVAWQVASYVTPQHYGKGTVWGKNTRGQRLQLESSVKLPVALYKHIYELSKKPIQLDQSVKVRIFDSLADIGSEWSDTRSERERPVEIVYFEEMVTKTHGDPKTARFLDEGNAPNFNVLIDRFSSDYKKLYGGEVEIYIHPSKNGKLFYLFARDSYDVVWNDVIEPVDGRITRWGAKTPPIAAEDLKIPAIDYFGEIPQPPEHPGRYIAHDNSRIPSGYGSYKIAFPYIRELPTIEGFYRAHDIEIPDVQ